MPQQHQQARQGLKSACYKRVPKQRITRGAPQPRLGMSTSADNSTTTSMKRTVVLTKRLSCHPRQANSQVQLDLHSAATNDCRQQVCCCCGASTANLQFACPLLLLPWLAQKYLAVMHVLLHVRRASNSDLSRAVLPGKRLTVACASSRKQTRLILLPSHMPWQQRARCSHAGTCCYCYEHQY